MSEVTKDWKDKFREDLKEMIDVEFLEDVICYVESLISQTRLEDYKKFREMIGDDETVSKHPISREWEESWCEHRNILRHELLEELTQAEKSLTEEGK